MPDGVVWELEPSTEIAMPARTAFLDRQACERCRLLSNGWGPAPRPALVRGCLPVSRSLGPSGVVAVAILAVAVAVMHLRLRLPFV